MQTVKVRLRKTTRVFTFLCHDIPMKRDEDCIVRSERGLEYGTCVLPPEPCAAGRESQYPMTVVRRATLADESTLRELHVKEQEARALCLKKIQDANLTMKLVDVEYTFDKHKVIFYFVAAERVDFRQLVRDLAQELHSRIELRHIQVRDEAKLKGGLGICGRELCCSTWLREFMPISMKMAKRQNLALNPAKISGQCSRLLCCLSYENDLYQTKKRSSATAKVVKDDEGADIGISELEETDLDVEMDEILPSDLESAQPVIEDAEPLVSAVVVAVEDDEEEDDDGDAQDSGEHPAQSGASPVQSPNQQGAPQGAAQAQGQPGGKRTRRRRRRKKHPGGHNRGPAS